MTRKFWVVHRGLRLAKHLNIPLSSSANPVGFTVVRRQTLPVQNHGKLAESCDTEGPFGPTEERASKCYKSRRMISRKRRVSFRFTNWDEHLYGSNWSTRMRRYGNLGFRDSSAFELNNCIWLCVLKIFALRILSSCPLF